MKPTTTRTLGPLHLEDLEPHRFEDMIRQLIYDFKDWQQLEATGRSGADDGFDARGYERVVQLEGQLEFDPVEDQQTEPSNPRIWLLQCKREKAIGPTELERYLGNIPESVAVELTEIIFAAACDFSKRSRDRFRLKVLGMGVEEGHLWGKAEIEDMLFQPKNDHLLFAYFGISLQSRRRSAKVAIRSKLATKRLLSVSAKLLNGEFVVVRDARDERFPLLDPDESKGREDRGRWKVWQVHELDELGLLLRLKSHLAYISEDGTKWDYAELENLSVPPRLQGPWDGESRKARDGPSDAWTRLQKVSETERGLYHEYRRIRYENIVDVDDVPPLSRDRADLKQIYVSEFSIEDGPFDGEWLVELCPNDRRREYLPETFEEDRTPFFDRKKP